MYKIKITVTEYGLRERYWNHKVNKMYVSGIILCYIASDYLKMYIVNHRDTVEKKIKNMKIDK